MFPANHLQPSAGIFSGKHQPSYQLKAQDVKKNPFHLKNPVQSFLFDKWTDKIEKNVEWKTTLQRSCKTLSAVKEVSGSDTSSH